MRICICGGGSLGHVCAAVFSSSLDVKVNMYTKHPEAWNKTIRVEDLQNHVFNGRLDVVTSNPQEAIDLCDIVLLCLPGFLIEKTMEEIKPYVKGKPVGSIVSSTGFFFDAHKVLGKDAKLFGFQRVPYIARVKKYGESADLLGYKERISVAVENVDDVEAFRKQLESLFRTPTDLLVSFYEAALTNSNPILHTSRLYSMFKGKEESVFDHNIFFYKEWSEESSQLLIEMDKEFFALLDKLGVNNGRIMPLLDYYESSDALSLTKKIRSIEAFQNIMSPMKEIGGGWQIDCGSRYFTEDFPYGLRYIYELAVKNNVSVPNISKVYSWGVNLLYKTENVDLQ
ncbi:MAG: NAD/NADP octopine/nopaline dehydrogenase family protein [Paludibacteraceae bacterium]|nr:NAD/NADP octopine/nopaline dehydrogenase family protein [Paludibacteraceae bacterium]